MSKIPFKVRSNHSRMDYIYNINTSKLTIRIRYVIYIIPLGEASEITEAYYGPLFKALLYDMNNIHITNIEDENSPAYFRYLIVDSEFNLDGEDYRIESIGLDKEELSAYSYYSNMVYVFRNLHHINLLIENTLNI